jgi:hypothetical protein
MPEHFVAPGVQTPTQPPPTHACPEQGIGVPGWPVESHRTMDPLEHCVVPGGHANPPSLPSPFSVASEASSDVPSGPSDATVVSCAASWVPSSPAPSTMLAS